MVGLGPGAAFALPSPSTWMPVGTLERCFGVDASSGTMAKTITGTPRALATWQARAKAGLCSRRRTTVGRYSTALRRGCCEDASALVFVVDAGDDVPVWEVGAGYTSLMRDRSEGCRSGLLSRPEADKGAAGLPVVAAAAPPAVVAMVAKNEASSPLTNRPLRSYVGLASTCRPLSACEQQRRFWSDC